MSEYENDKINEQEDTSSLDNTENEVNTQDESTSSHRETESGFSQYDHEHTTEAKPQPKKRNLGARRMLAVVVVASCIALVFGVSARLGYYFGAGDTLDTDTPATSSPSGEGAYTPPTVTVDLQQWQSPEVSDEIGTYVYVNEKASPSVVSIVTEAISYNVFYGNYVESGAGSGVIIARSGNYYYIITNNHVVDGYSNIIVYTADNNTEKGATATVIGTDWTNDIAIIRIESEKELTLAEPATSASVVAGQNVAAIGNPLGKFSGTITPGIISSASREVEIEGVNMNLLQHSASVSPGNSGGGLFNMQGQLIGIVNAKSSGTGVEGIGFAIPIDTAIRVANDIINIGYATGIPYLGISFNSSLYVSSYHYNDELTASGQQTIEQGDVLVAIDGKTVSSSAGIRSALSRKNIGDKVKLQLMRLVKVDGYRSTYEPYEVEVVVHEYVPTASPVE